MNSAFTKNIKSNKGHDVYLKVSVNEEKLYFSCHYFVKYFKTQYKKEFSLEELISNLIILDNSKTQDKFWEKLEIIV